MAIESATYVTQLVSTNPAGGDNISSADDHLRLIKAALVNTFTDLRGQVSASAAEINFLRGCSANLQTQINALAAFQLALSATLNTQIQTLSSTLATDINTLKPSKKVLLIVADVTLSSTTAYNTITWTREILTAADELTSTSTTQIVIPAGKKVARPGFRFALNAAPATGSFATCAVLLNGSHVTSLPIVKQRSSGTADASIYTAEGFEISCTSGDVFTLGVAITGNVTLRSGTNDGMLFWVEFR